MKLSEAADKAVFKVQVDIGEQLGLADPHDVWVELREPTYQELLVIGRGGGDATVAVEATSKMLPSLIVDHNIEAESGGRATSEDVAGVIRSSARLFSHVMEQWQGALPLAKKSTAS